MKSHTIFIYLGSIIEAVVFYFVQSKLRDEKSKRKYLEIEHFQKIDDFRKMRNLVHIKVFLDYDEHELIVLLQEAFIETKEIFDYIEENI
jgi:hypothetical protein